MPLKTMFAFSVPDRLVGDRRVLEPQLVLLPGSQHHLQLPEPRLLDAQVGDEVDA